MNALALHREELDNIIATTPQTVRALSPHFGKRVAGWTGWTLGLALFLAIGWDLGFFSPKLMYGAGKAWHLVTLMWPPTSAGQNDLIIKALVQTLAMALLGTVLVVLLALPIGILGARTIVGQPVIHFLLRRWLDISRTIPSLVWAMILVTAFGLGPRVGVTAMILAETPYLGKLFAETMESHKRGVIESLRASGATQLQVLRYGLAPQVLPLMTSKALLLFEQNIRSAAALGLVGAGGIGVLLNTKIELLQMDEVAWILMLFMGIVVTIDLGSQALRKKLINAKSHTLTEVEIEMEADA